MTKSLVLGGQISYGIERKESKRSFAGIFDDGTQMVQGLFDKDVSLSSILILTRMLYLPHICTEFQRGVWVIAMPNQIDLL